MAMMLVRAQRFLRDPSNASTMSVEKAAEELASDLDVDEQEVRERIKPLIKYSVPLDQAKQSVREEYLGKATEELAAELGVGEEEIKERLDIFEEHSVSLAKAKQTVRLQYGNTDVRGVNDHPIRGDDTIRMSVSDAVKAGGFFDVEFLGNVVEVQKETGLINRCPMCGRILQDGQCQRHGVVDGEFDVRIEAILQDDTDTVPVVLTRELIDEIYDGTLEDARKQAVEMSKTNPIRKNISNKLVGQAACVSGTLWIGEEGPYLDASELETQESNSDINRHLSSDSTNDTDGQSADDRTDETLNEKNQSRDASEVIKDRPDRFQAEAEKGTTRTRTSVPESLPTAPQLSLAYTNVQKNEVIGKGGNADVSHATADTDTETVELALKEPRMSGTLHTETIERMLEEAETWQQLDDHDHIVSVVDYGSEPLPWIAMEYMDGNHLGDRAGDLDIEQALWTAIGTTKAVRHAHRRGVAHLDLKPENVLFRSVEDAWDVPKVADWGLSKQLLEHSKSVEGMSPHYAAPEQFADKYGNADDITDVYQLGAVFYELFTGRPPFQGDTFEVVNQIQADDPTPPSDLAALPPEIDDILLTALATDKADRYEDVLYLRDELQDLFDSL